MAGECITSLNPNNADPDLGVDSGPDLPPGDCRLDEAMCEAKVCNVSTGLCEDCQRDLQCGDGGLCDMVKGDCTCSPNFHACGGQCVSSNAVETCGGRCEACPEVENATPTCVAGECSFACDGGFRPCEGCAFDRDCIECEQNDECSNYDRSVCGDDGLCEPCERNDDCTHLDRNVCVEGTCVQCTTGERAACGNNSCNPANNTCTTTTVMSRQWCETCLADSECEPGHRCVPMFYGGAMRPRSYCLEEADDFCDQLAPIQVQRTSLSGIEGEVYCSIREDLVTCEAVNDYGRRCDQNSDCGLMGLDDALCRSIEGIDSCTYACTDRIECPGAATCVGNPPNNSYCATF